MCQKPFRGAWRGAGSSGLFGLSRVCGSTNERDQPAPPAPRTRWTASESPSPHTRLPEYIYRFPVVDKCGGGAGQETDEPYGEMVSGRIAVIQGSYRFPYRRVTS